MASMVLLFEHSVQRHSYMFCSGGFHLLCSGEFPTEQITTQLLLIPGEALQIRQYWRPELLKLVTLNFDDV